MQIYQIYNTVTKKSYVGKSKNYKDRYKKHINNAEKKINRRLYDSINYHGIEKFDLILLEDLGEIEQSYVNEREKYWIEKLNTLVPNGYNMTNGGDGGNALRCWTENDKQKLWKQQASKRIGSKRSEETRKKMSLIAKNRVMSQSTKDKISRTRKERKLEAPEKTRWYKGQIGTFKGKKHSDKSKDLMSKARKGKKYENLLGEEKAKIIKQKLKIKWTKENNPKYVDFNIQLKKKAIKKLKKSKICMNLLSQHLTLSPYKIRQWFKELGISNYRIFCRETSASEWIKFWSNINVN